MGGPRTSREGVDQSTRSVARNLTDTKIAEAAPSESEPNDGVGIHLLVDELKRFQMILTEEGTLRYCGKRSGGDDRVFSLLLAVTGLELAEHNRFLLL